MLRDWISGLRRVALAACTVVALSTGTSRADDVADLKKLVEEQSKQLQDLKQRLDAAETHPVAARARS